jgi:hypothetical protein
MMVMMVMTMMKMMMKMMMTMMKMWGLIQASAGWMMTMIQKQQIH